MLYIQNNMVLFIPAILKCMDIFIILGTNPRAWCMLSQHFTAELHPGPLDDLTIMSLLLVHCGNAHGAEGIFGLAFCCSCVTMHGSPATECWRSEDNLQESVPSFCSVGAGDAGV